MLSSCPPCSPFHLLWLLSTAAVGTAAAAVAASAAARLRLPSPEPCPSAEQLLACDRCFQTVACSTAAAGVAAALAACRCLPLPGPCPPTITAAEPSFAGCCLVVSTAVVTVASLLCCCCCCCCCCASMAQLTLSQPQPIGSRSTHRCGAAVRWLLRGRSSGPAGCGGSGDHCCYCCCSCCCFCYYCCSWWCALRALPRSRPARASDLDRC